MCIYEIKNCRREREKERKREGGRKRERERVKLLPLFYRDMTSEV